MPRERLRLVPLPRVELLLLLPLPARSQATAPSGRLPSLELLPPVSPVMQLPPPVQGRRSVRRTQISAAIAASSTILWP